MLLTILKNIDRYKIEKFFLYCRTESISSVIGRIKNYINQYDEEKLQETLILTPPQKLKNYAVLVAERADNPLVSIVIFVDNQWEYTYNCIKKIIENTIEVDYEIIIADNCSMDKTKQIDKYVKNVIVSRSNEKKGFSCVCNKAVEKAKGQYIQILSQRTSVQKNWLVQLIKLAGRDFHVGIIGPKMIYPTGKVEAAGGIVWKDGSLLKYGNLGDRERSEYNYVKESDYISFTALLMKKDLWIQLNGFDEQYKLDEYSSADLAFEARKKGFKVVYQPLSEVIRFDLNNVLNDNMEKISRQKFFRKWREVLQVKYYPYKQNEFLARDCSRKKDTILVIDHYVPTFDKDAGSRTVYQYVKCLVKLGYNVKFMGDNFYRSEPYTTCFQQLGVEVLYGSYYFKNWRKWFLTNVKNINYIFLNRPHISIKYIDFVKKNSNAKVIYYGHDLHFLREWREYLITKNEMLKRSSEQWRRRELDIMRKTDVIFTLSTDEQVIINKMLNNKKAVIMPVFCFKFKNKMKYKIKERKDILFVGGFNHRPNENAVVWFMENIWPQIIKEIPECRFIIAGSNPTDKIKTFANDRHVVVTGYISDEKLMEYYQQCRISVIPLRYGAGVKGKIIEAMYYQIAVVSTSIGTEGLPDIDDYINSYDKAEDFSKAVIDLYKDENKLQCLEHKYAEYIQKYFMEDRLAKLLSKYFSKEIE
ncbi:glycosyltransferase [Pectinatus haikarae]|uniref:glycosyltransferase n=1 Tax=Pectinatus haikarae TaxID=349096 RepID=UPI001E32E678|nr:glycosyltransferase [Pectinatus haikarae]